MEISDVQVKAPKMVKCEEDDDFVNMFDKMMNETLKETKGSTVSNSQQMPTAPLHLRPKSKSYADPTLPPDHQDEVPEEKTIQFAVLMRKGQKQTPCTQTRNSSKKTYTTQFSGKRILNTENA